MALEFPLSDQFYTGIDDRQRFEGGYVVSEQGGPTQVTLYANKKVVDDSDPGFSASAAWTLLTASDGYKGNYHRRIATTENSDPASWTVSVPSPGYYDVYARYPNISGAAPSVTYEVVHESGTASVALNQQNRSARWNRLGCYRFSGPNATIRLSSQGGPGTYVIADAVRLVGPVLAPDTPPTTPVVTDDGQYTASLTQLHASWESQDLESGIDHYEYAIGTTPTDPGSGYVVPWTSTGTAKSVTKSVTLTQGRTYYFYVRAYNLDGLMSQGVSDGITADATSPSTPVVTDDGAYTGDSSQLHCSWAATDPESGIANYDYFVGTSPSTADVVPLTSAGTATQVWVTGLSLVPGKTYYFRVRARNGSGIYSAFGGSNGIAYQPATAASTIHDALGFPDSSTIFLKNKPISAVFADKFYLSEPDRFAGIAVGSNTSLAEGTPVDVTGALATVSGERQISPGAVTPVAP